MVPGPKEVVIAVMCQEILAIVGEDDALFEGARGVTGEGSLTDGIAGIEHHDGALRLIGDVAPAGRQQPQVPVVAVENVTAPLPASRWTVRTRYVNCPKRSAAEPRLRES